MIVIEVVIVLPIFKLKPTQQVRTNEHNSIFSFCLLFLITLLLLLRTFLHNLLAWHIFPEKATLFHATGNLSCFDVSQVMLQ